MRLILIIIFLFSSNLFAHQPKLINYSPTLDNPHQVIDPEISKAYYGKLSDEPHYYIINSEEDFLFYTGILSPKVDDDYLSLSLAVYAINEKNNKILKFLQMVRILNRKLGMNHMLEIGIGKGLK